MGGTGRGAATGGATHQPQATADTPGGPAGKAAALNPARIATTEAIAGLQALQRGTRHSGYRARIGNALAAAAASAGLSPSQLAEQVVPDAGLDTGGRRLVQAGPVTARIGLG